MSVHFPSLLLNQKMVWFLFVLLHSCQYRYKKKSKKQQKNYKCSVLTREMLNSHTKYYGYTQNCHNHHGATYQPPEKA